MNANLLFIFTIFMLLVSCNKADPNPELRDAIYLDLQALQGAATRDLAEAEKTLQEHVENLNKVVPQTGQIKYAKKRVYEAQAQVEKLKQLSQYYKLRIDDRLKYTRKKYLDSLKNNTLWPDQKEVDEYMTEKKLRQAKLQWDARDRIERVKEEEKIKAKAAPAGAE